MSRPVITLLGDSITAGYGLRPAEALPVRLMAALDLRGLDAEIIGAGISGDTIRSGLARVQRDVPARTTLCLIALGANDLMRSAPPGRVAADLDELVRAVLGRPTPVLLCGMRAPPWTGHYAAAFDAAFSSVARSHDVAFYPFLLDGVALDPRFTLPDGVHPNARGIEIIAGRLAPHVLAALRQGEARGQLRGSSSGQDTD